MGEIVPNYCLPSKKVSNKYNVIGSKTSLKYRINDTLTKSKMTIDRPSFQPSAIMEKSFDPSLPKIRKYQINTTTSEALRNSEE
jgi:hypothetical protein